MDFESVEALCAIIKNTLGDSGSHENIHQPEKPWLFEALKATSDIRCFGTFFPLNSQYVCPFPYRSIMDFSEVLFLIHQ